MGSGLLCYIKRACSGNRKESQGPFRSCSINLNLLSAGEHTGIAAHSPHPALPWPPDSNSIPPQLSSICLHTLTCCHNNHWEFAVYVGRRAMSLRSAWHVNHVPHRHGLGHMGKHELCDWSEVQGAGLRWLWPGLGNLGTEHVSLT